jgi:Tfp pilus assembly protein PilN
MINLLPERIQHSLRTAYYARLAAVVVFLSALAVVAGAALLAPSYFLALAAENAAQSSLTASERSLAAGGDSPGVAEIASVSEEVSLMKSYPSAPRVAAALSAVTADVPGGVSLSSIAMTPGGSGASELSVSGTASTRDQLLAFADSLKKDSRFSGVSVPLSQLVSGTNAPFSLSFSFTPQSL